MSKPRAQIVVHAPASNEGTFRFDLVDVDGPRRGQRLNDLEVVGIRGPIGAGRRPDPSREVNVRIVLHRYGERNGYEVVD